MYGTSSAFDQPQNRMTYSHRHARILRYVTLRYSSSTISTSTYRPYHLYVYLERWFSGSGGQQQHQQRHLLQKYIKYTFRCVVFKCAPSERHNCTQKRFHLISIVSVSTSLSHESHTNWPKTPIDPFAHTINPPPPHPHHSDGGPQPPHLPRTTDYSMECKSVRKPIKLCVAFPFVLRSYSHSFIESLAMVIWLIVHKSYRT